MMTAQAARVFDINNLKYEFKVDKDKQRIIFGNLVIEAGVTYKAKNIVNFAGLSASKDGYKQFNSRYDFPAKGLAKHVNRIFMEMLVDPVRKYSTRYAFNNTGPNMNVIKKLNEVKPILDQCELDGIENVQPICLLLGKNPADCKLELGRTLWKKLCKNSLTRNTYLYKILRSRFSTQSVGDALKDLNKFKSKYLKRGKNIGQTHVVNFNQYGLWSQETGGRYRMAIDTEAMANRLGEKFSLAWSKDKMLRKHDEYSLETQRRREAEILERNAKYDRQWESIAKYLPLEFVELNGYVASLIKTPKQLHREGEVMRHCVGGYSSYISNGEYLVYSITDSSGNKVSTLGLLLPNDQTDSPLRCIIDQHYGRYNSEVAEESALQLADLVVTSVNKLLNDEQKTK